MYNRNDKQAHMFKRNDRVWPVAGTNRVHADRVDEVSYDGSKILVSIYPDGLTYNGMPVSRTIGWRPSSDYVPAKDYKPKSVAYGYIEGDPRREV